MQLCELAGAIVIIIVTWQRLFAKKESLTQVVYQKSQLNVVVSGLPEDKDTKRKTETVVPRCVTDWVFDGWRQLISCSEKKEKSMCLIQSE